MVGLVEPRFEVLLRLLKCNSSCFLEVSFPTTIEIVNIVCSILLCLFSLARVHFGVFFPEDIPCPPVHMFFDREKASTKILDGACAHAGLKMDRGRLAGSPERLNLFTLEGDVLRLDLEIEAHLGSTLQPSSILVLEKGNRISDERLEAIKAAIDEQSDAAACAIM